MTIDEKEKREIKLFKKLIRIATQIQRTSFLLLQGPLRNWKCSQGEKENESICHRNFKYLKI